MDGINKMNCAVFCRMGVVLHSEMCGCGHIKTFSHGHSHGHGEHGHSHGAGGHVGNHDNPFTAESGTSAVVRQPPKKNINIRAAFIHVIGDLIQSIGVLIAAYIIKYKVRKLRYSTST